MLQNQTGSQTTDVTCTVCVCVCGDWSTELWGKTSKHPRICEKVDHAPCSTVVYVDHSAEGIMLFFRCTAKDNREWVSYHT